jgi:NAD(P)H-flavin reductase
MSARPAFPILPPAAGLAEPMLPIPWTVREDRRETEDTFTLELEPPEGSPAFAFEPGQFNMLYVFGVGEVPISISGDPARRDRLEHTTRAVGVVTKAMEKLRPGDMIGVRGPYGRPWPLREVEGKDVVLIAGGIGLAPLRPVLAAIAAKRERFGKVVLLYGARTPEDALYGYDLERWESRHDIEVHMTVDRASRGWRGAVGFVTALVRRAPFDRDNAAAMICGPEVMMRYSVDELRKRGLDDADIYISTERNMKCAIGHCGHCQLGPEFVCKDGPVFPYSRAGRLLEIREL